MSKRTPSPKHQVCRVARTLHQGRSVTDALGPVAQGFTTPAVPSPLRTALGMERSRKRDARLHRRWTGPGFLSGLIWTGRELDGVA
jgi:hypothetical protein